MEKIYLTQISIEAGIITLIDEDEEILGKASVKYPAKEADDVVSCSLRKV